MKLGYTYFWAFDNFGNLILSECPYAAIRDLNRYNASQKYHACSRTIYYIDVLAATEGRIAFARDAIADYRTNLIER